MGVSDGEPARPVARALRPVLAGTGRGVSAPRRGGPRHRGRRVRRWPEGKRLAALADAAERAPRHAREACENELSAALAMVDPAALPSALVAELADAEARVLLARRFHNDAVRDTLALRERPTVRLLRLGGTASLPTYFEIAERSHPVGHAAYGVSSQRTSARVVLLDDDGAVLLLCGSDPAITDGSAPRWWFTVGARCARASNWRKPPLASLPKRPGCASAPTT
ncbi:putative exopolyphosphatase [Mycobacterium xenopi 4042]|uniref:Putative exopolyphosphatase n=1 Tax=Mycobacterium xenopi 4042 TaxID=1299334 RepID=X8CGP3_MYCXE|nr:putative exopolyphosphatase [Mycobacterium xenopi 4042]